MSDLNHAIQLIRQGQKFEAQRILQELLKTQPNNIQAWFWYVETCSTTERRIQVLETCLKMNPGNPQVMQALQHLQVQRPAQTETPAPQMPSQPAEPSPTYYSYEESKPEPETQDSSYGYEPYPSSYEQEQTPAYLEDVPTVVGKSDLYGFESYRTVQTEPEKPAPPKKQSWELETSSYTDNSMLSKQKKPKRTYSVFDVWMTAVTSQDEKAYADLLEDPEAGLERAFSWIAIAGLVTALTVPVQYLLNPNLGELLDIPELQRQVGSMTPNAFIIILTMISFVTAPIGGMLNLAISGGIQNFLAMFFGGGGNYTRTVYALAAFLAPMTIITSIAAVIPVVGGCLSLPFAIYNFVLNVRALKAAHSLGNGAAVGVMLAPTLLILIFACLFVFMTATSLPSS